MSAVSSWRVHIRAALAACAVVAYIAFLRYGSARASRARVDAVEQALGRLVVGVITHSRSSSLQASAHTWMRKLPRVHLILDAEDLENGHVDEGLRKYSVVSVSREPGDRFGGGVYKPLPGIRKIYEAEREIPWDWLLIVDDDTFVMPTGLARLVASLDSSAPIYMGYFFQGGVFAYGGAGFLLSRAAADRLYPRIPACVRDLRGLHGGDIRVGHCVRDHGAGEMRFSWAFMAGAPTAGRGLSKRAAFHAKPYTRGDFRALSPRIIADVDAAGTAYASDGRPAYYEFSALYGFVLRINGTEAPEFALGMGVLGPGGGGDSVRSFSEVPPRTPKAPPGEMRFLQRYERGHVVSFRCRSAPADRAAAAAPKTRVDVEWARPLPGNAFSIGVRLHACPALRRLYR
eukprot:tig00021234_g19408.t1